MVFEKTVAVSNDLSLSYKTKKDATMKEAKEDLLASLNKELYKKSNDAFVLVVSSLGENLKQREVEFPGIRNKLVIVDSLQSSSADWGSSPVVLDDADRAPTKQARASEDRSTPAFNLTGNWDAETFHPSGQKTTGTLKITQTDDYVTAVSRTGGSTWIGKVSGNLLNVTFTRPNGASGKLALTISKNGNELTGVWDSASGFSNPYRASRSEK